MKKLTCNQEETLQMKLHNINHQFTPTTVLSSKRKLNFRSIAEDLPGNMAACGVFIVTQYLSSFSIYTRIG